MTGLHTFPSEKFLKTYYYRWKNTILFLLPSSLSQTYRDHLELSLLSAWLEEGNVEEADVQPGAGLGQSNHEFSLFKILSP